MITKKKSATKKIGKKENDNKLNDQLAIALSAYKIQVGEKKFKNILKKTSKLIKEGIAKAKNKKVVVVKKKVAIKKTTAK